MESKQFAKTRVMQEYVNGRRLWGGNVWTGYENPTDLGRNYYLTRDGARAADISDTSNVICRGSYLQKDG